MLTFESALDVFKQFPQEEREELIEILQKRQSQEWRQETADYYKSIKEVVKNGEFESFSSSEAIDELHKLLN